jgi:hypothetical protein
MWGRPFFTRAAALVWSDDADLSLRVGVGQTIRYAKYTVMGIGLGLASESVAAGYRRPAFRVATLVAAAAASAVHVAGIAPTVSRAAYSLAVFLVLLRPSFRGKGEWLRPVARYSYPIYILHPAVAQAALALPVWFASGSTLASLLAGSVAVFAASGAAARLLRAVVPADWFLPLVPVGTRRAGTAIR